MYPEMKWFTIQLCTTQLICGKNTETHNVISDDNTSMQWHFWITWYNINFCGIYIDLNWWPCWLWKYMPLVQGSVWSHFDCCSESRTFQNGLSGINQKMTQIAILQFCISIDPKGCFVLRKSRSNHSRVSILYLQVNGITVAQAKVKHTQNHKWYLSQMYCCIS